MPCSWRDVLLSYFHESLNKSLTPEQRKEFALENARIALGEDISLETLMLDNKIQQALNNLGVPYSLHRTASKISGYPATVHPLAGTEIPYGVGELDQEKVCRAIANIVKGSTNPQTKFLRLWRHLRPSLERSIGPWVSRIPSDSGFSDDPVWNKFDFTSGLSACLNKADSISYLTFHLGPVQEFIQSARSLRDLWSGSMLLSYLTFSAMTPVIDLYGPSVFVYPALRDNPFLDRHLQTEFEINGSGDNGLSGSPSPCLPNRFLAIVPSGKEAEELANKCKEAVLRKWQELAGDVHKIITKGLEGKTEWTGWDVLWDQQINNHFHFTTMVLPGEECTTEKIEKLYGSSVDQISPDAAALKNWLQQSRESESTNNGIESIGMWKLHVDFAARLMEVARSQQAVPTNEVSGNVPQKCSLMGTYEQMGPAEFETSKRFWNETAKRLERSGIHLRENERLCAIALTKRIAPSVFKEHLDLSETDLRYPDTATVAAAYWLKRAKIDYKKESSWSGQWLHWPTKDHGEDNESCPGETLWEKIKSERIKQKPPTYYAILMMDGDNMGKWLHGDYLPKMSEVLHPSIIDDCSRSPEGKEVLLAHRPITPMTHAAISEALTNFSLHVAPKIVKNHMGALIYSGGDDVLALLPLENALRCANELRFAFSGDPAFNEGAPDGYYRNHDGRDLLMMGMKATISAGLAVVHYKEDLRFALNQARQSEKEAKDSGRNMLQIRACRRSGEHTKSLCPWPVTGIIQNWMEYFTKGTSDRWCYQLRSLAQTVEHLPPEAQAAVIKRQINRAEKDVKHYFTNIETDYSEFHSQLPKREITDTTLGTFEQFITLVQAASFFVRGRD